MSAGYKCDRCKKKMSFHQNSFKEHQFLKDGSGIRVLFIVDWNQWTENDICEDCALDAITQAAKEVTAWTKEQRRRKLEAEKAREVEK